MVFEKQLDFLLGWVKILGHPWDVIAISFFLTLLVNLSVKFLSDQKKMKILKEEGEFLKSEMKKFKDHPEKYIELQKKAMESSMKYMRHSMVPTMFTLLPLLVIFNWLRKTFSPGEKLINFPFTVPLIGSGLGWLGTYIICSIIFNLILRKLLKLN